MGLRIPNGFMEKHIKIPFYAKMENLEDEVDWRKEGAVGDVGE
jgi:hypothetical protein